MNITQLTAAVSHPGINPHASTRPPPLHRETSDTTRDGTQVLPGNIYVTAHFNHRCDTYICTRVRAFTSRSRSGFFQLLSSAGAHSPTVKRAHQSLQGRGHTASARTEMTARRPARLTGQMLR